MKKIVLKEYYTGHPLTDKDTWKEFYQDFGLYLYQDEDGLYDIYEDEEMNKPVVIMVPYLYHNTPVKISREMCYIHPDWMDYIFHLMYKYLLYETKIRKRLLPAPKLNMKN